MKQELDSGKEEQRRKVTACVQLHEIAIICTHMYASSTHTHTRTHTHTHTCTHTHTPCMHSTYSQGYFDSSQLVLLLG